MIIYKGRGKNKAVLVELLSEIDIINFLNNFHKEKFISIDNIFNIINELKKLDFNSLKSFKHYFNSKLKISFGSNYGKRTATAFWKIRGYLEEDIKRMIKTNQTYAASKITKETYSKRKFNSKICNAYWKDLGYSDDEISEIMKNIQSRGYDFYKKKGLSDIIISEKLKTRNETWQRTLQASIEKDPTINKRKGRTYRQLVELYGSTKASYIIQKRICVKGYSNSSQLVIKNIILHLKLKEEECNYGEHEFYINYEGKFYKFDLKYKNLLIEFNGDFWHMNPKIYRESDIHPITKFSAKSIWEYDDEKRTIANSRGYIPYTIWESDWNENKNKILEELNEICLKLN